MTGTTDTLAKGGLTLGYLALAGAVLLARASPASGYELSIYGATPAAVWAGVGAAVVTGLVVARHGPSGPLRGSGFLLAGGSVLTVLLLPVIRGYYFYGAGDSLSHLGWATEIAGGSLSPFALLYPAIHAQTVLLSRLGGVPLALSNMYVVLLLYVLVFLLFVPLCVQLLTETRRGLFFGLGAALLLMPINNISIHPVAHPSSQAVLLFPFVLYLTLRYLTGEGAGTGLGRLGSRTGALLGIATLGILLVHPQQALNVVVFLGTVLGVQVLVRRLGDTHPIVDHRLLHAQTALAVGAFLAWAPRFQRAQGAVLATILSVVGVGPTAGEVVGSKSTSLVALGGSLPTLFVKLFLPGAVFTLLAAGLVLLVATDRLSPAHRRANALLLYLSAALVPLGAVFLLLVVSSTGDMYFRYQGFIMVFVTVLGAVALARLVGAVEQSSSLRTASLGVVLLLLLLPVGLVALHPSPYMYQPSPHVPQSQLSGYETAFDHRAEGVQFAGVRSGPRRYVDAVYGTERARDSLEFPGYEDGITPAVFNNGSYGTAFDEDRYIGVTASDRAREVDLYGGFRYRESGFRALDRTPGVSRVQSSEGFQLYFVDEQEA